ncbi:MAG TPA: hypothetical protein VIF32_10595 [Gemmatimonadaceae bacterium]
MTGGIAATGEIDSIAMVVVIGGTGGADAAAVGLGAVAGVAGAAESSRRLPTRPLF